jgi:transcription elongation factor
VATADRSNSPAIIPSPTATAIGAVAANAAITSVKLDCSTLPGPNDGETSNSTNMIANTIGARGTPSRRTHPRTALMPGSGS